MSVLVGDFFFVDFDLVVFEAFAGFFLVAFFAAFLDAFVTCVFLAGLDVDFFTATFLVVTFLVVTFLAGLAAAFGFVVFSAALAGAGFAFAGSAFFFPPRFGNRSLASEFSFKSFSRVAVLNGALANVTAN